VLPALILLAVILLFVFQNLRSVKVSFVTASGRLPLAVALLAAAALGALVVLALGSVRMIQLRKLIRHPTGKARGAGVALAADAAPTGDPAVPTAPAPSDGAVTPTSRTPD
jgi:uncharacterized integral membrane protein